MLTSVIPKVYRGAIAPEALQLHVWQDESDVDLSTVTAAVFQVRLPNGVEKAWAATIAEGPVPPAPTVTDLWLLHPYASGDVGILGRYRIFASLTVPSGVVRSVPTSFDVVDEFG